MLNWRPLFSTAQAVEVAAEWYMELLRGESGMRDITLRQIESYLQGVGQE
jgi:hypothetical protein